MKATKEWLLNFVDVERYSVAELAHYLSIRGVEAEPYTIGKIVDNVVVAKIESIEKHPDADKLRICQTSIGSEVLQIVTAAPNVYEGMYLPLAKIGTNFGNGFKIKKSKLRGVESFGMFCSKAEFEMETESSGVWDIKEFVSDLNLGQNLFDFIKITEGVEIEITPNRPDALSVYGIARELSAIFSKKIKPYTVNEYKINNSNFINVVQKKLCPRYLYAKINGVKVKDSPKWMQDRLLAIGVKPINNIVDITNYILFEYNHPMHAFDASLIKGGLSVDFAKDKEVLSTLDGLEHELDSSMLTIRDDSGAVAVAGIIGGEPTSISDTTNDIILEIAYFDPVVIRKASKKLVVSTDSSYRFERGIDPNDIDIAGKKAVEMVLEMAGGELLEIGDVYPEIIEPKTVTFSVKESNDLLDLNLTNDEIKDILLRLGFAIKKEDIDEITVIVPTFRPDVAIKQDIFEEIARINGYENIPSKIPFSSVGYISENDEKDKIIYSIKKQLSSIGMHEVYSQSMVSEEYVSGIYNEKGVEPVKLANSLTKGMTHLRVTTVPSLMKLVFNNISKKNFNLRLFEFGYVYEKSNDKNSKRYSKETGILSGVITGKRYVQNWASDTAVDVDIYDVKALIEKLSDVFDVGEFKFQRVENCLYDIAVNIIFRGKSIGHFGLITSSILEEFDISQEVYFFEINYEGILGLNVSTKYKALPVYPVVDRDLSFVVPFSIESDLIKKEILRAGGKYIKNVEEIDYYVSEKLGNDVRSISYRMYFEPKEKTFTDSEIDGYFNSIIKKVEKKFAVELRK